MFGTELERMVAGEKHLAVFYKFAGENFDETGGQDFRTYVKRGHFVYRNFLVLHHSGRKLRYVAYFAPKDEWRYELYKALKKSLNKSGWNENKESFERALLDNE